MFLFYGMDVLHDGRSTMSMPDACRGQKRVSEELASLQVRMNAANVQSMIKKKWH